jgi:5-methylcytosine-specific restriction protein A
VTEQEIRNLIATGRIVLFYKRGGWKRKRRQILRRDHYECQKCKREGRYSRAQCVHHIEHIEDSPDLALADYNLESLCNACHNEEHPEKLKRVEVDRKEHITPERW